MFFSSETSVTEKRTHLPEGEICGSETRFIAMRSAKVMGRFCVELAGCWAESDVIARAAMRNEVARRIGGKCSAVEVFVDPLRRRLRPIASVPTDRPQRRRFIQLIRSCGNELI